MRIIHPRVEVRIHSGAWIDDMGRRAGPVLESRLELLGERADVLMAQEQMVREAAINGG